MTRIARRRIRIDDERFASIDCESPGQVLDYINRHPTRYPGVVEQDIYDGLVLWVWEWWESNRRLYELLTRGRDGSISYREMGEPLGLGLNARKGRTEVRNKRQGVLHRIDRLEALLKRGGRPDANISREARRVARERAGKSDPEVAWLVRHHEVVVEVADQLIALKNFAYDEARSSLIEVEHDRDADEWSAESLYWMVVFVQELRVQDNVFELPSQHKVKRGCHAADELMTAFTNLVEPTFGGIPAHYTERR